MEIFNYLPNLLTALEKWKTPPNLKEFREMVYAPMSLQIEEAFGTAEDMFSLTRGVDWDAYRKETLHLNPEDEEKRVRRHLADVEKLFGFQLQGEILLFGSFETMDGYARFEKGKHRVFLGVDESHRRGRYLDVLEVHELTHVARESRPSVWEGWGLSLQMTNSEFVQHQPVMEHLFGEGFSCTVSELLVPDEDPWHYAYQEKKGLELILKNAASVNQIVHREILAQSEGDWGRLYNPTSYTPRLPVFTHYVWAWKWVSQMVREHGNDPTRLLEVCSKDLMEHALKFQLK